MRYTHEIQTTTDPAGDIWQTITTSDQAEDHDGTAADYGRDVLTQWIDDEQLTDEQLTDRDGNALIRVIVRIDGEDFDVPAATVEHGEQPDADLEAVIQAAAEVLHADAARQRALDNLSGALADARAAGHGANRLADRVAPAVSRPVALRMMRAPRFATADAWADALDAEMKRTGRSAGDLISHGYTEGHLLGVGLNPEHEDADDERGVIVGDAPDGDTWTVRYNAQSGWWEAA